jgi:hypothetical protein
MAVEDGFPQGRLQNSDQFSRRKIVQPHDLVAAHGRLPVAQPVFFLEVNQFLPNDFKVLHVAFHFVRILRGDVALAKQHEIVDVVAVLIAIVAGVFTALVFLYRDAGRGKRVVWMLTLRVALSVSLVAFLVLSYYMGWIGAGGVR